MGRGRIVNTISKSRRRQSAVVAVEQVRGKEKGEVFLTATAQCLGKERGASTHVGE